MRTERPTPHTDAACQDGYTFASEDLRPTIDFARKLERQRDEARERADSKHGCWMFELRRATELEKQLEAMREEHDKLSDELLTANSLSEIELVQETQAQNTQLIEQVSRLIREKQTMRELLREIRDDEVNAQDEADKFLRDHQPSELSRMREAIKEAHEAIGFLCQAAGGGMQPANAKMDAIRQGNAALAKLQSFLP